MRRFSAAFFLRPLQTILRLLALICATAVMLLLTWATVFSTYRTYEWLHEAMEWYEKAEKIRPEGNDDALLRWNACARTIMERRLEPAPEDRTEMFLE